FVEKRRNSDQKMPAVAIVRLSAEFAFSKNDATVRPKPLQAAARSCSKLEILTRPRTPGGVTSSSNRSVHSQLIRDWSQFVQIATARRPVLSRHRTDEPM